MKRNFVVSLFGGLVGFGMLFILLSAAGIVGARGADIPRDQARPGAVSAATPLTSTFTYQGQLKNGGDAVNGSCDMAFRLYDDPSAGNLIGSPITTTVSINSGFFTVGLNFGDGAFTGNARWLDIRVRCPAGSGSYTTLTPRQQITGAPYALAPWVISGNNLYYNSGNVGIGTSSPQRSLHVSSANSGLRLQSTDSHYWTTTEYQTDSRLWHTGVGGSAVSNDVQGKYYILDGTASQFRMVIDTNGNVGIGTTAPSALLSVVKSGALQPSVQGFATGVKVGTPAGTMPLALRQNAAENTNPGMAYFETGSGDLGYLGANAGAFVVGAAANKALAFDVNGSTRAMTIASDGVVAIGTTNPIAKLHVHSTGTTGGTNALYVDNGNGDYTLAVSDDGRVFIGHLGLQSNTQVCIGGSSGGSLDACGSAAEYVPTIDTGLGFPETADIVSIAPEITNPYNDAHSPFVVQKSTTACDPNLLGYITDPEKGADGEKKNEHYLPLAIFGYFPVKVTLENGVIKRGDPLTSSSKPGYAMKATQACKIIGYALEDADHEGTIQVFAHLSENTAPQVAALTKQLDQTKAANANLEARVNQLEQQNTDLATRLSKLEQNAAASRLSSQPESFNMFNLSSLTVIGGVMIVWLQQRKRRGGAA